MRHVRRFTRSHDGGGKPGNDRHRATAGAEPRQGELQLTLCGRSDDRRPREDQGQPQTNIRICGQTRASEVDHRRLKASLPPLHDHPHRGPPGENRRGERNVALSRLDMGHQSAILLWAVHYAAYRPLMRTGRLVATRFVRSWHEAADRGCPRGRDRGKADNIYSL